MIMLMHKQGTITIAGARDDAAARQVDERY